MKQGYFRVSANLLIAPAVVLQLLRDLPCVSYITYKIRKRLPLNEQTAIAKIKATAGLQANYIFPTTLISSALYT